MGTQAAAAAEVGVVRAGGEDAENCDALQRGALLSGEGGSFRALVVRCSRPSRPLLLPGEEPPPAGLPGALPAAPTLPPPLPPPPSGCWRPSSDPGKSWRPARPSPRGTSRCIRREEVEGEASDGPPASSLKSLRYGECGVEFNDERTVRIPGGAEALAAKGVPATPREGRVEAPSSSSGANSRR